MLLAAGSFEFFRDQTVFIQTGLNGTAPEKAHGAADLRIGQIFEQDAIARIREGRDNGDARSLRPIGNDNAVKIWSPVGSRKPFCPASSQCCGK